MVGLFLGPCFLLLYLKISVTNTSIKERLSVCVNEMAQLGPYATVVKTTFDGDGSRASLSTRRDSGPARYKYVLLRETCTSLKVSCLFVHYVVYNCRR